MINLLDNESVFKTLLNSIDGNQITVFGCDLEAKLTIAKECGKTVFFMTSDIKEAVAVKERFVESGYRVAMLNDKLDFKLNPFNVDYNVEVLNVLCKVLRRDVDVVILNPMFLYYPLPNIDYLNNNILTIKQGDIVDTYDILNRLVSIGFFKSERPEINEFNVKGDMIDICTADYSVRLYFDFDKLSHIKTYDRDTLLNTGEIEEFCVYPSKWIADTDDVFTKIKDHDLLQQLDSYRSKLHNILWCLPFSKQSYSRLQDYVNNDVIVFSDTKMTYNYLQEEYKTYKNLLKQESKLHEKLIANEKLDFSDITVIGFQYISNQNKLFNSTKVFNIKTIPVPSYINNFKMLVGELKQNKIKKYTTVIYAKNKEGVSKLKDLFTTNKIEFNVINSITKAKRNEINVIEKNSAFSINLEVEKLEIIGSFCLFGRVAKKHSNQYCNQFFTGFLPEKGDFVVHTTHGIGKCAGVECLQFGSAKRDYVIIEYKDNDRLYLPVENIDLIDKYVGDQSPKLNKLGSTEFLKTKEKVRAGVKKLAFDLSKLYADRNKLKGYTYPSDDEVMKAFEDSFGYDETPDQLQAIDDIKKDMHEGKLMDRLICGDVGFGKTEVALRAVFKTILAGKQVALLCPTTILSQQHYNTAIYRMRNFGVNIEVLNRFCSPKEVESIYSKLANGEIDLIVGTHKLLNKNVTFKNLGLLVLDEEQKFGVSDKEKIKNLKKTINVLTLSATPIPRTLNMSLVGIRDISIIETPPISRIPTSVKVVEQSDVVMERAISNELSRGGQVLIVYNRVESIYKFASHIKNMFKDVVIDVAHGQMEQRELENAIFRLYNNETDVLISTTLIENGIDLPNANTLIVVNADMLGLSQLYQLKGRVGRSDRQAFAYFLYDANKLLTDTALKRLEAITDYTAMGSGFKIAMRDLEIRGAGSIFGAEQSGHMEKVGYAMYLKLLNDAVGEIKGQNLVKTSEIKIETSESGYIPNDYIPNYDQRISLYMRISKIDTLLHFSKIVNEIGEVYGAVPKEVVNLCKFAFIKNMAGKIDVKKVCIKPKASQLVFSSKVSGKVSEAIEHFNKYVVLNDDKEPIIKINSEISTTNAIDLIVSFLEFILT